ncbi:hypothetical protein [Aeromonas salmonicida]|uniref:hypothetical protein n=1 Tax=Aeromonas salmonicida TaxID=645 RepID=UPI000BB5D8D9|nr:hypothetical protein [Aeromonas salmonicida]PBO12893.1 hypothetical protein CI710_00485 [Aeromonas salmonicida]
MSAEENEENEWHAIEESLRLMYGDNAYQRMTEDEWWRYDYCGRRKKLERQIERQRITIVKPLVFLSIFADPKTVAKINRQNGQRSRWLMDKLSRRIALEDMGPIDNVTHVVTKMSWHPHHAHIWAVATYPGVTSQQLTDYVGVASSNHRMVFRRLNNDLYHVGWQCVSSPIGYKNEPWGWYLEKI